MEPNGQQRKESLARVYPLYRVGAAKARQRWQAPLRPHHGSRTSSSAGFLAAVHPAFAVVSAGYRNRFRHPNARVLERYRARGIRLLRTDRDGEVEVRLAAGGAGLRSERARRRRYWHTPDP